MPHSFQRQLDDLYRRLRRVAWTFGLCRTVAVAMGLFVFLGVLDTVLRFDPPIFRIGLLATWALTVFGVAWESLVRPIRRLPGRARLAEIVERRFDSLRGELAAAVEFAEDATGGEHDSKALREAVIAAAEKNSSETDFGKIVDRSTARQAAFHAQIAVAILVILAVVFPDASRTAAIRFFAPYSAAASSVENGEESEDVSPAPPLRARLDDIQVKAPPYAASTTEVTRDRIRAVAGSTIVLGGATNCRVVAVSVEEVPLAMVSLEDRGFSVGWLLKRGGPVHIHVADRKGRSVELLSPDIHVVDDLPPTVRMPRPPEGLFAVPSALLRVDGTVEDDFGIAKVDFVLAARDAVSGETVERPVSLFQAEPDELERRRVSVKNAEIPLGDLGLRPGQEAVAWIRAVDLKGQAAIGPKRRIAIVSPEEALALLRRQEAVFDLGTAIDVLIRGQEELRARLGLLLPKTRGAKVEELPPEGRAELAGESKAQSTLEETWTRLAERLRKEDALDATAEATVGPKMDDAKGAIAENRLETAIESQDAVLAALADVRETLKTSMRDKADQAASEGTRTEAENGSDKQGTPAEGKAEDASDAAASGGNPSAPPEGREGPVDVEAARRAVRLMEGLWGTLPPRERPPALQLPPEAFPPEYVPAIEAYFRELSRERNDAPRD